MNYKKFRLMKKIYIAPRMEFSGLETTEMLALSLQPGVGANPNEPVLAPEKNDWDIWDED